MIRGQGEKTESALSDHRTVKMDIILIPACSVNIKVTKPLVRSMDNSRDYV